MPGQLEPLSGYYFLNFHFLVGLEGVGPIPKPDMELGHQRSESSSDSFVCVSESATNEGERMSQEPVESESWELVGRDSRESPGSPKSPTTQNKNKEENFDIEDLLGDDTPVAVATDDKNQKGQGAAEDSNSDWENWDD